VLGSPSFTDSGLGMTLGQMTGCIVTVPRSAGEEVDPQECFLGKQTLCLGEKELPPQNSLEEGNQGEWPNVPCAESRIGRGGACRNEKMSLNEEGPKPSGSAQLCFNPSMMRGMKEEEPVWLGRRVWGQVEVRLSPSTNDTQVCPSSTWVIGSDSLQRDGGGGGD
jgi:hypothetical protein